MVCVCCSGKKVAEKMDKLLEQNKTIAKALSLMHDTAGKGNEFVKHNYPPENIRKNLPLSQIPGQETENTQNRNIHSGGYQKSISSNQPDDFLRSSLTNQENSDNSSEE